eukprot:scaffold597_cov176-Amphora_coffeaeformis.AAC.14
MSSARSSRRSGGGSSRSKSPDQLSGEQPGLRRLVQKRLLEDVFDGASGESVGRSVGRSYNSPKNISIC